MKKKRSGHVTVGVCDIGTFTALILIARADRRGLHSLFEERCTIDLLADSGTGTWIGESAVRRLQQVLGHFNRIVSRYSCERAVALGTAAIRRAGNRKQVVRIIGNHSTAPFFVLSARSEARLTAEAARAAFPRRAGQGMVIDIGGGSTEVTDLASGRFQGAPVGAANATASWERGSPDNAALRWMYLRNQAQRSLSLLPRLTVRPRGALIGTGGTLATLAAIAGGFTGFDPARLHGQKLSRKWITSAAEMFSLMTTREIATLAPFDTRRARVLTAGTFLWAEVLNRLCAPSVTVSVRGLRWGAAVRLAEGGGF